MKKILNKIKEKKGFTLAELLIVVAIIAVLVAIAIPVFMGQLEKSRESTDLANIRAAYAEVMAKALEESNTDVSATVSEKQTVAGWVTADPVVAGVTLTAVAAAGVSAVGATTEAASAGAVPAGRSKLSPG